MKHSSVEKQKSWLMRCKTYWLGEWFDPHKSFLKLPAFWGPTIVIIMIFVFLCCKVSMEEGLEPSWDWSVGDMYSWYKIPFWVLALLIPVVGLFNANHKSEQARAAMELTRSQNNFANYYKHLEEFSKFCNSIEREYTKYNVVIKARVLHKLLFPKMIGGDPKIPMNVCEYIIDISDQAEIQIRALSTNVVPSASSALNLSSLITFSEVERIENELSKNIEVNSPQDAEDSLLESVFKLNSGTIKRLSNLYIQLSVLRQVMAFDSDFYRASLNSIDVFGSLLNGFCERIKKIGGRTTR